MEGGYLFHRHRTPKRSWLLSIKLLLRRVLRRPARRDALFGYYNRQPRLRPILRGPASRWYVGDIQSMTDREFQAIVATLFRWLGYAVMRTPLSRDSGMDLILAGHEGKAIVQCKRWRHPVGPAAVREFYGTIVSEDAALGYLITTGVFSKDARRWARDKGIVLVDGPSLKKLMAEI